MSIPFVGEIRMFAGNFAPQDWAFCDGQLLSIAQNEVLFNLIGTTYGGDGQTTFALPDMRGRIPVHAGPGHPASLASTVEPEESLLPMRWSSHFVKALAKINRSLYLLATFSASAKRGL